MANHFAEQMATEFVGTRVAGWLIEKALGHGKSAVVFSAARGPDRAALKIFDRQLVERYGRSVQKQRTERERHLVGKSHPHLVKILDAGEDTERNVLFVAMEFFNGRNLAERLQDVPPERIRPLIAQVASAAKFLESLDLVHRDIKPENIGVSDDFENAILLDLGVLRPVSMSEITDDEDQKIFVATRQYSPPELLVREEGSGPEAWRAITFYQLGAVLHDMITRKPIFHDHRTPEARMVEAVRHVVPTVVAATDEVPRDLVVVAQNCLVKNAEQRLKLVTWDSFAAAAPISKSASALERIASRRTRATATSEAKARPDRKLLFELKELVPAAMKEASWQASLPPVSVLIRDDTRDSFVALYEVEVSGSVKLWAFAEVRLGDPSEPILEVRFSAYVGTTEPSDCGTEQMQIFYGVKDDDAVRLAVKDAVTLAFDDAQYYCEQATSTTTLGKWLNPT